MLKMKNILPVFVVLLFLGVASTAFAQISCSVASTPVSRDSSTGFTEPAGDITFACTATGTTNSSAGATITVTYGVPITNDTVTPTTLQGYNASKAIAVNNSVTASCPAPTSVTASNAVGSIVIALGAIGNATIGTTCNYTLTGVLLGISGTSTTAVVATVSVSPGNNLLITAGQNTPTVVTSVLAPITTAGATVKTPGIVPTTGVSASFTSGFTIAMTENYIDMFRDITTFNGGAASNSVQATYTFAGIPTGMTFDCTPGATIIGPAGTPVADGAMGIPTAAGPFTISSTNPTVTTGFTAGNGPSLTAIDTVNLVCSNVKNGTATLPLTAGSITATVTLAPTGTAFSTTGAVLNSPTTTGAIPRYSGPSFGPVTVINIVPLTTHMLFPFVSVGNGFDTGLVIANTTADPYGPKAGGAAALGGPVTVAFYPSAAGSTPFCASTGAGAAAVAGIASCTTLSGTTGSGLSSGGVVASGSTWAVLGSAIFSQITPAPGGFTGYAFAIANFPYGHPTSFVADATFSGKFASGGPALVVPNPTVVSRGGTTIVTSASGGASVVNLPVGFSIGLTESLGH